MYANCADRIHQGEIFVKSQCMTQEHKIAEQIWSILESCGYSTDDPARHKWFKQDKKIITRFVDDFSTFRDNQVQDARAWFDSNTLVLTDNRINFAPEYQISFLPNSYFGIYFYSPYYVNWLPDRDLHYSVNRIDSNRLLMLHELLKAQRLKEFLQNNYVNVNADLPGPRGIDKIAAQKNFVQSSATTDLDQSWVQSISQIIPIRNHSLSVEQANVKSWLTLVVETYAGNSVISMSEKTFRALVTPAPWILYAGLNTVNFLRSMGFDCLDDVIDHSYDRYVSTLPLGKDKIELVASMAWAQVAALKAQNFEWLKPRLLRAAQHNIKILGEMSQQLPADIATWYSKLTKMC